MGNTLKNTIIGFVIPPVAFWIILIFISFTTGFIEWQSPFEFFNEYLNGWINSGTVGENIRMLLIINIIWTFVYVKAYEYLKKG